MTIDVGTYFESALVKTIEGKTQTRPRIRAIHYEIPEDWNVEFPTNLRVEHPIGTRFRSDLVVAQKHDKKTGKVRGQRYLRSIVSTIELVSDFTPESQLFAVLRKDMLGGRSYEYIELNRESNYDFNTLRDAALGVDPKAKTSTGSTVKRSRSALIKSYVRFRANGTCESCDTEAPFIARDGKPYLEVHHIVPVSMNGEDSIFNTAAICPNCHTEITNGVRGKERNDSLANKIREKEVV